MTHRVFSRNAMSSRAVPVAKMIAQVRNDPAQPIHWGANQPGMQANGEIDPSLHEKAIILWRMAAGAAADRAEQMAELGLHKQVVNRVLEPFQWMHTIVTATETDNFFSLRRHEAADPNIKALADVWHTAMEVSQPRVREAHIPYITHADEILVEDTMELCLIAAARCARVSYLNHDGTNPQIDKDLALAAMLRDSRHASPFEHVAFAMDDADGTSRNFVGWTQFRQVIGL
jgi:thymidylate synthase ThyX